MRWLWRFATSSIGAKIVMAATGILLLFFLVGHLVGNLQIFAGPDPLNAYAKWLHEHRALIWTVRIGMIAVLGLHVLSSARLTLLNRAARPIAYCQQEAVASTWASRNMFVTGSVIFAFVLYHLAHFTLLWTNPEYGSLIDSQGRKDVFTMMVTGFSSQIIAGSYLVAVILLGFHLSHSISSSIQTLGFNHPRYALLTRGVGPVFSILLGAGFLSIPIAIQVGLVELVGRGV